MIGRDMTVDADHDKAQNNMIELPTSVEDAAASTPGLSRATIMVPKKVITKPSHEMRDKGSLRKMMAMKAVHIGVEAMIRAVLLADVLKIPIKKAT